MKACEQCGDAIERLRTKEGVGRFAKRRFCGRRCSFASNVKSSDAKLCKACGGVFRQRPNERPHRFASREYCGRECSDRGSSILVDVFGVKLSRKAIADLAGVSVRAVGKRIRKGHDPLTGRKL